MTQPVQNPAPVMNVVIPETLRFPAPFEDQFWTMSPSPPTLTMLRESVPTRGCVRPTLTHPDPDALAYAFPVGGGWNSGDLYCGLRWHELAHVGERFAERPWDAFGRRHDHVVCRRQNMLDNALASISLIDKLVRLQQEWPLAIRCSPDGAEPCLFLPRDMGCLSLISIGVHPVLRDVVTNIYLDTSPRRFHRRMGAATALRLRIQERSITMCGNHGMR